MTVPGQVEEDDDDDMPPLECVGTNTPTAVDDDDDDSMPPLDYVGLAPPKEPERKPVTPAADDDDNDDDDDMPPLEYVGTSATHVYSFREGARVRTKGLSKAELNSQTGTILPFLGATKDRLPVRLDTGKSIKIKPENLEALPAAGPELTPEPRVVDGDDSDDSMPPLEVQPQPAATSNVHPQAVAAPPDDDDDDDMPPLDYVGTATGPAPVQAAAPEKTAPENLEEDDDDMPPLEYVGLAPQAAPAAQAPAPVQHEGHKAAAPAPTAVLREGDRVVLKGLSKTDLNGQSGAIMSPTALNTSPGRLPVKLDASGKGLAIKLENLERLKEEEEDDDDMPPLECDGAPAPIHRQPAAEKPQDPTPAPQVEDDDDDMPPLEYVGMASPAGKPAVAKPQAQTAAPEAEDDDDELPPLECVGTVAPAHQQHPVAEPQEVDDDGDDMPPLESVGVGASRSASAAPSSAPVQVSNALRTSPSAAQGAGATTEIQEGDRVVLRGLKKADLNGQKGTVLPRAGGDRWPVRLSSGKQGLFKPENLEKLPVAAADSTDSMPPLDYVGGAQEKTATSPGPEPGAEPDADDDDDLPPLEYVGAAAGAALQPPSKKQDPRRLLSTEYAGTAPGAAAPARKVAAPAPPAAEPSVGPSKTENTRQPDATADRDSDDDDMPPLEYVGTAAPPHAQQKEPASHAVENDEDDDDDMPPLEYVGTAEPARAQATPAPQPLAQKKPTPGQQPPRAQANDDDDDDMPPLEYVGSTPAGDFCFAEGDEVILKGLSKAELNGQRGTVMPFLRRANGRLPIRLKVSQGSSNKVSIKPENLEKIVAVTSTTSRAQPQTPAKGTESKDEDDDDMPPLEYVGNGPPPTPATPGAADDGAASDDSMPPLDYTGIATPHAGNDSAPAAPVGSPPAPAVEADIAGEDSGDSMPPLEYTGQAAAPVAETPKFKTGDFVILRDLRTADLNGERAQVVKADPSETRVRLELVRTGKKLMVKWDNLERAPPAGRAAAVNSDEEVAAPVAAAAATHLPLVMPAVPRSPETLLEQMRQAMQSTALPTVMDALAQVEGAENVDWGELQQRKKQLLKKLRAKRRKLQSLGDESPLPADAGPAAGPPRKAAEAALEPSADELQAEKSRVAGLPPLPASGSDKSSQSEKDWVVLTPGASRSAGPAAAAASIAEAQPRATSRHVAAALREWCEELQLPSDLVSVLEAEEVTDPLELTGVSEEELMALTQGWKIGPKGRFMKAVRRMRAAEQAELGSTCGSIG